MMRSNLETPSTDLFHSIAKSLDPGILLSVPYVSASVYDTAWVAMIDKVDKESGVSRILFPECLQFLLDSQMPDGSWDDESSRPSSDPLDGILHTLAALLALKTRCHLAHQPWSAAELESRCRRATLALRHALSKWSVGSSQRIGFEVTVPSLLCLLEAEGIDLAFDGRGPLVAAYNDKIGKLCAAVCEPNESTLAHYLEIFAGRLDYDRVKHHLSPSGHMMASPSSTAAYLIHASTWDDKAEQYLHKVVETVGAGQGSGRVPTVFPTTVADIAWPINALFDSGYTADEIGQDSLVRAKEYLIAALADNNGLIGFDPECLPDADDSSVALGALQLLGHGANVRIEPLLSSFETPTHFVTYKKEKNPGFSTNCNVLLCLLRQGDLLRHTTQVVKTARFLAKLYYENAAKDKFNLSEYYPLMLMTKAFQRLYTQSHAQNLSPDVLPRELVDTQIPDILCDVAKRLFKQQLRDWSWGPQPESSAYALVTLTELAQLPWSESIASELSSRIHHARDYLLGVRRMWQTGEHVWVGKVAHAFSNMSLCYCLAAVKSAQRDWPPCVGTESVGVFSLSFDELCSRQLMFTSGIS